MKRLYPVVIAWFAIAQGACQSRDTSRLSPERDSVLAAEGVIHRAANVTFRYTHDGWEERVASIIVTRHRVLIYKNDKIGLEIKPSSRRGYDVAREADRVRISAGTGKSREIWSFVPPDSAAAWTESIRVVIKAAPP